MEKEMTYAEAIRDALSIEMRRNKDVFMLGEDIGVYGGAFGVSVGMVEEFGEERIRDTPISEAAIVGAAIGAAVTGMRPVAEIQFSDFITIGMDQLVNQAAKMRYMFGGKAKVPMVLRAPAGSGTGAAGQHSSSMEAWYAHVPGLKVVIPSSPADAKGLLASAIEDDNPVVFLEQKLLYRKKGLVPEGRYTIPLSTSEVKRKGSDLSIVTWGRMVDRCLEVADLLAKENVSLEVIDPRTVLPLDSRPIIESVKKTGRLLIVHEAVQTGGFGGEIAAQVADSEAFWYLDEPIKRLGAADVPIPYNPQLEAHAVPTVDSITKAVRELFRINYGT